MGRKKGVSKLTPKQLCFVSEYLVAFNATQAAKNAGYSEKMAYSTGHELLKKPEVQRAVQARISEIVEKNDTKIANIIMDLQEVKDRCMQAVEVMEFNYVTKQLEPTGEWKFDSKGALKALEMLGKYLAMFKDTIDLSTKEIKVTISKDDSGL